MNRIRNFLLQWHITPRCGNRCRHCYVYDEKTYDGEAENQLDLDGLICILDSIAAFQRKWQAVIGHIVVTGGDPLLHPQWVPFMKEIRARNKQISIYGNPETLTRKNLDLLAGLGVGRFQMSLDGLEKTHDYFRSRGSFERTVNAIDKLKERGIFVVIMFTLYPENRDQLIPLMNFVITRTRADVFNFDAGVCSGNASSQLGAFTRDDIKSLLSAYIAEKKRIIQAGYPFRAYEKNNLLRLLRYDEFSFFPFSSQEVSTIAGCNAGWDLLSIISDGTVMACRRSPALVVGKMPEQSFEEILLGSELLRRLRRPEGFEECGSCAFFHYCRGCPAVVSGLTGDPFASHPHCFRDSLMRPFPGGEFLRSAFPSLDCTPEVEYDLIARTFGNILAARGGEFSRDPSVQIAQSWLSKERREKRLFFEDPDGYLRKKDLVLTDLQKIFIGQALVSYSARMRESSMHQRHFLPQGIRSREVVPFSWSPQSGPPL